MEEYPPVPKKNKLGALAFLEVGIFEIFFVKIAKTVNFMHGKAVLIHFQKPECDKK